MTRIAFPFASAGLALAACVVTSPSTSCFAVTPEQLVACPVSPNLRGHENIEWSIGYAYNLTDAQKSLPRALLVGDSICNAYQTQVRERLAGRMTVSYWVSSYCLTSPCYLKFLSIYLDEADYSVIHFNNGLHSLGTADADWEKGLRAALTLIRLKQPKAKIVWTTSTPLKDAAKTLKAKALNAVAAKVIAEFGGIAVDDLFSRMDPLDRAANWSDTYHFKPAAVAQQAEQVSAACLAALCGTR